MVPGIDGRKMSKSYGNTIAMFAAPGEIKKAVMGIVTDSTPVEAPKDPTTHAVPALVAVRERRTSARRCSRARGGRARLRRGEEGPARAPASRTSRRCASGAPRSRARPSEVEDVLADGARRARAIARPVLDACREAAGLEGREKR